jgi:hypothetical protein
LINWQSRIRSTVRHHQEYASIDDFKISNETADIVFNDRDGKLTKSLIAGGYLQAESWKDRTPKYWIEVKTTTSRCETPFMVGRDQSNFMEAKRLPDAGASDQICLLVRVFKLGQVGMGLKFYVDPRRRGAGRELSFHAENYKVVPA